MYVLVGCREIDLMSLLLVLVLTPVGQGLLWGRWRFLLEQNYPTLRSLSLRRPSDQNTNSCKGMLHHQRCFLKKVASSSSIAPVRRNKCNEPDFQPPQAEVGVLPPQLQDDCNVGFRCDLVCKILRLIFCVLSSHPSGMNSLRKFANVVVTNSFPMI